MNKSFLLIIIGALVLMTIALVGGFYLGKTQFKSVQVQRMEPFSDFGILTFSFRAPVVLATKDKITFKDLSNREISFAVFPQIKVFKATDDISKVLPGNNPNVIESGTMATANFYFVNNSYQIVSITY